MYRYSRLRKAFIVVMALGSSLSASAQLDSTGVSAGFFDNSASKTINFSNFHLPPLAVLFENAKQTPKILSAAKAQEIAQAEVAKQKRHIFSYVNGHASYGYGKTDMWGNNSSTYSSIIYQYQGATNSYWNLGVSLSVPVEDILDLGSAVRRKRLLVEQAQISKDEAYDQLKLQIATLYVKITNDLVLLKAAGENAAIAQGAGQLNQEDFHNGNMSIEGFASTKRAEASSVAEFQNMQTQITVNIMTLEIMTHTPILTNATTEVTLENTDDTLTKRYLKEKMAKEKEQKKVAEAEEKRIQKLEKADAEATNKAVKVEKKGNKTKK